MSTIEIKILIKTSGKKGVALAFREAGGPIIFEWGVNPRILKLTRSL
jgi:hypothetical protein